MILIIIKTKQVIISRIAQDKLNQQFIYPMKEKYLLINKTLEGMIITLNNNENNVKFLNKYCIWKIG